jgi:hypothetical protein
MSKTYQGHKNWNHWNVSLWIGNDEGLYNLAKQCIRLAKTTSWYKGGYAPRDCAAFLMKQRLSEMGNHFTPDGAPYSVSSIRSAMRGL